MFCTILFTATILWASLPQAPSLRSSETLEIVESVPVYYLLSVSPLSLQRNLYWLIRGLSICEKAIPYISTFGPSKKSISTWFIYSCLWNTVMHIYEIATFVLSIESKQLTLNTPSCLARTSFVLKSHISYPYSLIESLSWPIRSFRSENLSPLQNLWKSKCKNLRVLSFLKSLS